MLDSQGLFSFYCIARSRDPIDRECVRNHIEHCQRIALRRDKNNYLCLVRGQRWRQTSA